MLIKEIITSFGLHNRLTYQFLMQIENVQCPKDN